MSISLNKKTVGVVRFLGTNCDFDIFKMIKLKGLTPQWLWHNDRFNVDEVDSIIIPGGFSYGDYLRCGALSAKSPVMNSVREFAAQGKPVLGICNGFQILCESKLLDGALVQNQNQMFIDEWSTLNRSSQNPYFATQVQNQIKLPIAHGEGRFYASSDLLKKIQDQGLIWWTYENNPNGSMADIAGIMNEKKNVAALMPHPERALFDWMGGTDGWEFLV